MFEVLWGKKFNQSSIQNAQITSAVGEEGRLTFRNAVAVLAVLFCLHSHNSFAVTDDTIPFNIPQQRADTALTQFAEQANLTLVFPFEQLKDKTANRLVGDYPIATAINLLLRNTGLTPRFSDQLVLTIVSEPKGKRMNTTNSSKRKTVLAGLVGLFAAGGMTQAVAQGGEAATSQSAIDEIIVTANKREQSLQEVPISIVALGADDLEARGIRNFEDLGFAVPGLTVQDNGGVNRRIFIRGIGNTSGFSAALVGLYIDDVSVSGNPSFTLNVRPFDLERVEVLRGPQGTLYGDASAGGTIRFITRKPQLNSFGGHAELSSSFTENGDPSHKTQAAVNLPIVSDKFGLRVAASYEDLGGWIDQPAASVENFNSSELLDLRVTGLWQVTEALDISTMVLIHRNDSSLNVGEDEDGNFTQVFGLNTRPVFEDEYELYNIALNYNFGSFELVSSTGYLDSHTAISEWGFLSGTFGITQEGPVDTNIFTQELRLGSLNASGLNWTLGAFYKDRTIDQVGEIQFGPADGSPIATFPFSDEQVSESWAVFGDVSFDLTDKLEVGGGVRYFKDNRTGDLGAGPLSDSFESTSPRVYANYDWSEGVTTYASAAKGFRSGGFNPSSTVPAFDPENIWTYELGTKMSLYSGRLAAELALYYSEYKDYQIFGTPVGELLARTVNGGDAEIKGIDVSFAWSVTDDFALEFSGSHVKAEVVSLGINPGSTSIGDRLPLIPEYSLTASVIHDVNFRGRSGFVRLDYQHQDEMLGFAGVSDPISILNFKSDFDVSENVSIGVFARNLSGERGFIDPLSASGLAARPRPRTYGIQLGIEF